ncbi:unnamed protein product [Brassica rapa subsp. trilocularis]
MLLIHGGGVVPPVWEARNIKRGGDLPVVDMLILDSKATLMEATVEFSHGQSSVGTVIRVESSRFLLTGYVNLEASQTAIVGISAFINSCTNGQMSHL